MTYLKYSILYFSLTIALVACHSSKNATLNYIDKNKPSLVPQIFAPEFISKNERSEYGSVFSKDGSDFYFAVDENGKSEILYSTIKNGKWTEPIVILSHPKYSYNDPFLSPNEDELYYISDMPKSKSDTIVDFDIWYSRKENSKWSAPINAGPEINSDKNEYYISFTSSGTMYFASNKNAAPKRDHDFDIYSSVRSQGNFQKPQKLSDEVNTKRYEADVFVAPDESYLIFCTAQKEGFGKGDLYISFKNEKGWWTKAKNMGNEINSEQHELCPYVTADGKFLFYTSNSDIYWVDAKIIERYR